MRLGHISVLVGIVATGNAASATLIVHDNRDQAFRWDAAVDASSDFFLGTFLDVREPASTQTGTTTTDSSFGFVVRDPITSNGVAEWEVFTATASAGIAAGSSGVSVGGTFLFPARVFDVGDVVGADSTFTLGAATTGFTFAETTPLLGDRAVIGVSFDLQGSTHYGWIELSVEPNGQYQPTGWAWETEAGISAQVVAIPGVSTASLVLAGGIAKARRRR